MKTLLIGTDMNTHTGAIAAKLEESGVVFLRVEKETETGAYYYIGSLDQQEVARADTKSACILKAAKALGEPI